MLFLSALLAFAFAASSADAKLSESAVIYGRFQSATLVYDPKDLTDCLAGIDLVNDYQISNNDCQADEVDPSTCITMATGGKTTFERACTVMAAGVSAGVIDNFGNVDGKFVLATRDVSGSEVLSSVECALTRTAGKFLHGYELTVNGYWDSSIASRPLGNGFVIESCTVKAKEGDTALAVTDTFSQKIVTSDASTMLPAVSVVLVTLLAAVLL